VLRLHPRLAPCKVAVLPLLKNKEALAGRPALHAKLQRRYAVAYDDAATSASGTADRMKPARRGA